MRTRVVTIISLSSRGPDESVHTDKHHARNTVLGAPTEGTRPYALVRTPVTFTGSHNRPSRKLRPLDADIFRFISSAGSSTGTHSYTCHLSLGPKPALNCSKEGRAPQFVIAHNAEHKLVVINKEAHNLYYRPLRRTPGALDTLGEHNTSHKELH